MLQIVLSALGSELEHCKESNVPLKKKICFSSDGLASEQLPISWLTIASKFPDINVHSFRRKEMIVGLSFGIIGSHRCRLNIKKKKREIKRERERKKREL